MQTLTGYWVGRLTGTSVVLATVPGYLAAGWVWNRTGRSGLSCYLENRGTQRIWGRGRTGPQYNFMVPTTVAPIKYLNSYRIATWSIREICRFMPCFNSHCQICHRINIRWVASKLSPISLHNDRVSIATQQLLIRLQIGEWEMKEGIKLHISRMDYVVIRWELQYSIEARNVDISGAGFVWKPVAMVRLRVGTGPRTKLGIWTCC